MHNYAFFLSFKLIHKTKSKIYLDFCKSSNELYYDFTEDTCVCLNDKQVKNVFLRNKDQLCAPKKSVSGCDMNSLIFKDDDWHCRYINVKPESCHTCPPDELSFCNYTPNGCNVSGELFKTLHDLVYNGQKQGHTFIDYLSKDEYCMSTLETTTSDCDDFQTDILIEKASEFLKDINGKPFMYVNYYFLLLR